MSNLSERRSYGVSLSARLAADTPRTKFDGSLELEDWLDCSNFLLQGFQPSFFADRWLSRDIEFPCANHVPDPKEIWWMITPLMLQLSRAFPKTIRSTACLHDGPGDCWPRARYWKLSAGYFRVWWDFDLYPVGLGGLHAC